MIWLRHAPELFGLSELSNAVAVPGLKPFRVTNTNPTKKLPRVHVKDLHHPDNRAYLEGRLPFITTGVVDSWKNTSGYDGDKEFVWSLNWFMKMFPHSNVDFYPHNMAYSNVHPWCALQRLPVCVCVCVCV
jgi:hypothetical protein